MKIVYFIFRAFAFTLSLLPFRIIYLFSDFFYFIIYYVWGYRKKVVYDNLKNSFPEKSDKEIRKIAKKYYHRLADVIVEVLKKRHLSEKQINKRFHFKNTDLLDQLYSENKSVFLCIGHCGNWEWLGPALMIALKHKCYAVVKPLSDAFFDSYMNKLRNRLNDDDRTVPFKQTLRFLVRNKENCMAILIAADQTPHKDEINYWTDFLNQETAFFLGTEKMAKSLDMPVVFLDVRAIKRGHYEVSISPISLKPKQSSEHEITEIYVSKLEESIKQLPHNWLWSHRRWKYKRPSQEKADK